MSHGYARFTTEPDVERGSIIKIAQPELYKCSPFKLTSI
jgi:hypothetical protein